METVADNRSKGLALLLTLGFHGLLFFLFILIVFITPIPPFEEKPATVPMELEADLGFEGMGAMQAGGSGQGGDYIPAASTEITDPAPVTNTNPDVITDDTETEVAVKTNHTKPAAEHKDAPTVEEEKASAELLSALSKIKHPHKNGTGQGTGNTGGSGDGTGHGLGNGTADEFGNGNDHGPGGKNGYYLAGRKLEKGPERLTDAEEEGIVVVKIIVDENGKVKDAVPGQRGSSTFSPKLFAKARQAALTAVFSKSAEGIKEQVGTYTFVFTLE